WARASIDAVEEADTNTPPAAVTVVGSTLFAPTKAWTVLPIRLTAATRETAPEKPPIEPPMATVPPAASASIEESSDAVKATFPPAVTWAPCCTNAWMVLCRMSVTVEPEAARATLANLAPAPPRAEPTDHALRDAVDRAVRLTPVAALTAA